MKRVYLLDMARGIAAISVAIFHYKLFYSYNINTETVLILYKNGTELIRSANNELNYESTSQGKIYDSPSSSVHLFEVENRNIRTYIDDPGLTVDGNKGKSIITTNINLRNLSDNTAPIRFTVIFIIR